jgi:hypothetical protein
MFAIVSFSLPRARSITGHNMSRASSVIRTVSAQHVTVAAECSHLLVFFYAKTSYYLSVQQICSLSLQLNIYDPVLSTYFLCFIIFICSFTSFFPLRETVKLSDGSRKTSSWPTALKTLLYLLPQLNVLNGFHNTKVIALTEFSALYVGPFSVWHQSEIAHNAQPWRCSQQSAGLHRLGS